MNDKADCQHRHAFRVDAVVNFVEDQGAWEVSIQVFCNDCGEQFSFIGLPVGIDLYAPTAGAFRERADLPIVPGVKPPTMGSVTVVPVSLPTAEPSS